MCPLWYLKKKKLHIEIKPLDSGRRQKSKFAAGQEVNPGWRNFCRAQEERRIVRHEGRHLGFVMVFLRF